MDSLRAGHAGLQGMGLAARAPEAMSSSVSKIIRWKEEDRMMTMRGASSTDQQLEGVEGVGSSQAIEVVGVTLDLVEK